MKTFLKNMNLARAIILVALLGSLALGLYYGVTSPLLTN